MEGDEWTIIHYYWAWYEAISIAIVKYTARIFGIQVEIKTHQRDADSKWVKRKKERETRERARWHTKKQGKKKKDQAAHNWTKHLLCVNRSALKFSFHTAFFSFFDYLSFYSHGVEKMWRNAFEYKLAQETMFRAMHLILGCIAYVQQHCGSE